MMKKLLSASLLLMLTLGWATPVFAQGGDGKPGQVIFGSDLVLEAGDAIDGDVVIFGGDLEMKDGSRIEGDVVVFGGSGEINGTVGGDVALIGGSVSLGPTAEIGGNVASVGGEVEVDEDAYVRGQVVETTRFEFGKIPLPPIKPIPPRFYLSRGLDFEPVGQFFRIVLGFAEGLIIALVVAAIGLLVVLFLPGYTQTVEQTISEAAPASFGVGLLTLIVGVTVMILLFITICLIPVGLLLVTALVVATLYGWVVIGYLLGKRTLRAIQKESEPAPVVSALVGIFAVTLVQQGLMVLGRTPCLGFFFWLLGAGLWLLIVSIGLGAVVLTRFGTQAYTGASPDRTPPPALPPTPLSKPEQPESPGDTLPEPGSQPADAAPESEDEPTDSPDDENTTS